MLKGGVHHEDVVILFVCLGFFVCFVGFFGGCGVVGRWLLWSCFVLRKRGVCLVFYQTLLCQNELHSVHTIQPAAKK